MLAAALFLNPLARLDVRSALDILIIAILIYYFLKLLRGTRAVQMLIAIVLLVFFTAALNGRGLQWSNGCSPRCCLMWRSH